MNGELSISPDQIVYARIGAFELNATLVFSWAVMLVLVLFSLFATSGLSTGRRVSKKQNILEIVVSTIRSQVREITGQETDIYLPFLGTLFLFIALSNTLTIIPGFQPPTGSIHTTAALALCVFFAVPYFGIRQKGAVEYFKRYIRPTPLMLPFNIISDLSRTLSLAIRLFGNIMSGTLIVAILVSIIPLVFPVVMQVLGLLIGFIQAYIFTVLAAVYIGSATRTQSTDRTKAAEKTEHTS